MNNCTLEEHYQCCCKCIYRVPTFEHCSINPNLRKKITEITGKGVCICSIQNGWACNAPESRLYTNWPEHSIGCELYTTKEVAERFKNENNL